MSHFVNYEVNITEEKSLIKALEDLEYAVSRNDQLQGWGKRTMEVDIAAKKEGKHQIGFVRSETGYDVVADWMYIPGGEKERIQQHYNKHEVMDAFNKARYSLKSVEEIDGELVLIGARN